MSPNLTGLFLTGVLLVFIGMIFLLKRRMPPSDNWIKIYVGIGLILAGRFMSLLDGILGIQFPAVLSGANRVVLEGAIGYLGGAVFLLAGFADLVPNITGLFTGNRKDNRKKYLYDTVNSLIYPGCDIKTAAKTLLSYISNIYKFKGAYVHLVPPSGGVLRFYTGKSFKYNDAWLKKDFPLKDSLLGRAILQRRTYRSNPLNIALPMQNYLGKGKKVRYTGIPIITGIKPWGVIGFISDYDYEEPKYVEKLLIYLAERIGICLDYEKAARENKTKSKYLKLYLSVMETLNRWPDLSSSLPRIAEELKKYIDFEYMHLARLDECGENMWRFVYSKSGQSLIEKGINIPLETSLLGRIIRNRQPEIFIYNPSKDKSEGYKILDKTSKCMGVPLFKDHQLTGAILLTSGPGSRFDDSTMNILRFLSPVLAEYLNYMNLREKFYNREKRLTHLAEGFGAVSEESGLRDVLKVAAKALTTELPVTSCRIMLLENKNQFLRTVGLYQLRDLDWDRDSLNLIPITSAYSHHKAVIENRPLVIDLVDATPAIKTNERKLLFYSGLSTAIIIPISDGENIIGILSLGEMRSLKRRSLNADDLNFAMAISSRLGLALKAYSLQRKLSHYETDIFGRVTSAERTELGLWNRYHNKVMNALSGIMGSCELLTTAYHDSMDSNMLKYLGVINRNSERIHTLIGEFEEGTAAKRNEPDRINRVSQIKEILTSG